ncbi:MAG TPA: HAMP domain-containing sensor histidine kinase [Trebonia sp.]|nr:HAMP domain-containing sensor histidine kinase [Trebonia sp.]
MAADTRLSEAAAEPATGPRGLAAEPRSRPAGWLARWWWRRGLRARVTITAAAGLLITFAAFDLLLFNVLRISLTSSLDDSTRQAASGVVALINADRLPSPVPVAPGITVQVLDQTGRIINVSPDADRLVPIISPAQASASASRGTGWVLNGPPFDMPSVIRVDAERAANGDLVIAAVPYNSVSDSLEVVARGLAAGTPVLFILFTWLTWVVVGSTLRPVGALRRAAARVTATGVPRDLPVPEARDEVRELAVTLNDMLSRLAAAQQRQRALVSDTAHELRSPIASIRTQLEVALDHPELQEWAATARDVHADTLRLARLAEGLLLLARLDEHAAASGSAPRPGRDRRLVDLAELAGEVVARYPAARVPVTIQAPRAPASARPPVAAAGAASLVVVPGDRDGLDRLLVNLIDNAVRFAGSQVTVEVAATAARVLLTVIDDGPGIAPADLERAFDRFARLDSARSRDADDCAGAGLGLAIVRATAQAHGGTAHLEPGPAQRGLRAIVSLPRPPGGRPGGAA